MREKDTRNIYTIFIVKITFCRPWNGLSAQKAADAKCKLGESHAVPFLLRPTNCSQFNPFRRAHAYIRTDWGDEHYCIHGKLRIPLPPFPACCVSWIENAKEKRTDGSAYQNSRLLFSRMENIGESEVREWSHYYSPYTAAVWESEHKSSKRECEKGFWMVNWDVAMYIPLNEEIRPKRIDPLHPLIWLLRQQLPFSLQKRKNSLRGVASVTSLEGNWMPLCQKHRKYHTKLYENILSIWN